MQGKSSTKERGPLPPSSGPIVGNHNVDTHNSLSTSSTKKRRSPIGARPSTKSPDPAVAKTLSRGSSPEVKGSDKRKSPSNDRRSPSGERERKSPANLRTSPVIGAGTSKTSPWRTTGKTTTARRPVASVGIGLSSQKGPVKATASALRPQPQHDEHPVSFVFEDAMLNGAPQFETRVVHHNCQNTSCTNTMHVIHHAHPSAMSCACCFAPEVEGALNHKVISCGVDEGCQTHRTVEMATQTGTPSNSSMEGSPVEEQFLSLAQQFAEEERMLKLQQDAQRHELRRQWIGKLTQLVPSPGAADLNKLCSRLQLAFSDDVEGANAVTEQVVQSIAIPNQAGRRKGRDVDTRKDSDTTETHPVKDSSYQTSSSPVAFDESPDFDALIADESLTEGTAVWDSELVALMASRKLFGGGNDQSQLRLSNDEIEEEVMRIIADVNEREMKKARLGTSRTEGNAIAVPTKQSEQRPPAPDPEQMMVPEDGADDASLRLKKSGLSMEFTIGSPNKNCTFNWTTNPPKTAHQTSAQVGVPKLDIAAVKAMLYEEGAKPDVSKQCHTLSSPRSAFSAPERSTASSASNDDSSKPSPYPSPRVVMTAAALRALGQHDKKEENVESFQKVVPSKPHEAWASK